MDDSNSVPVDAAKSFVQQGLVGTTIKRQTAKQDSHWLGGREGKLSSLAVMTAIDRFDLHTAEDQGMQNGDTISERKEDGQHFNDAVSDGAKDQHKHFWIYA